MLIDSFKGKYAFLSNYYCPEVPIKVKSKVVPTLEHAFQATKTLIPEEQEKVLACKSPGAAKTAGRKVTLRGDWEAIKINVMIFLVACKFEDGSELARKLVATGDAHLVEGNDWGDKFWGCVQEPEPNGPYQGLNHLGMILMGRRTYLANL